MDLNNVPNVHVDWTYCSFVGTGVYERKAYNRFYVFFKEWDSVLSILDHGYDYMHITIETVQIEFGDFICHYWESFTEKQQKKLWKAFKIMLKSALKAQINWHKAKIVDINEALKQLNG